MLREGSPKQVLDQRPLLNEFRTNVISLKHIFGLTSFGLNIFGLPLIRFDAFRTNHPDPYMTHFIIQCDTILCVYLCMEGKTVLTRASVPCGGQPFFWRRPYSRKCRNWMASLRGDSFRDTWGPEGSVSHRNICTRPIQQSSQFSGKVARYLLLGSLSFETKTVIFIGRQSYCIKCKKNNFYDFQETVASKFLSLDRRSNFFNCQQKGWEG